MDYNDELMPQSFEDMAKAYSNSIKEKGFVFINLTNEDYSFLVEEVFDVLFKLRSSYRKLNGFMGANNFFELNEKQIDALRELFSYTKNRAFLIRTNQTKTFLNTISLEAKLLLKLNELAQKSDKFEELSLLANTRLITIYQNYKIEGVFNNLNNLSFK